VIFSTGEHGDCPLTDDEAGQLLSHLRPVIAKNDDTYEIMDRIEGALGTDDDVVVNAAMVSHIQSALHDLVGEGGPDVLPPGLQGLYRALM
jgi:hypothetical protein